MKNTLLLFTCVLLWQYSAKAQHTKRILFIGNSYTFYNTLPALVNNIAQDHGDTVIHASSTPGGAQLVQHVANNNTMNLIRQGNWDYVVIQEQSQKPSFSDAQVATDVYPYAAQLNDSIELYNPCAETVFYMTWGRKNGDQQNCAFIPALCTFKGMNARLRNAYLQMSTDNDAIAAPVGAVWEVMRDSFPWVELYTADESHPSYAGSYLAASTFYAAIFRKPLTGTTYYGNLADSTAEQIHRITDLVVLDSLDNWYIGAYDVIADFNTTVSQATVSCNNLSTNAQSYQWDFGDGSATNNTTNPTHAYAATGTYTIALYAIDSCNNIDTSYQSITVSTLTPIQQTESTKPLFQCFPNPTQGQFTIRSTSPILSIQVFNQLGQEVFQDKNRIERQKSIYLNDQANGIYYIHAVDEQNQRFVQKLVLK